MDGGSRVSVGEYALRDSDLNTSSKQMNQSDLLDRSDIIIDQQDQFNQVHRVSKHGSSVNVKQVPQAMSSQEF